MLSSSFILRPSSFCGERARPLPLLGRVRAQPPGPDPGLRVPFEDVMPPYGLDLADEGRDVMRRFLAKHKSHVLLTLASVALAGFLLVRSSPAAPRPQPTAQERAIYHTCRTILERHKDARGADWQSTMRECQATVQKLETHYPSLKEDR
jgi:hypothetical protein